ncbi:RNase H domain-containing protein [Phthorimaea operculella]|nr:RNase H domain-containing protein [Phthorimaea operculella]
MQQRRTSKLALKKRSHKAGWTFAQGKKENVWQCSYRIIKHCSRKSHDQLLRSNETGGMLTPEDSAKLLADTFYPEDTEVTDSQEQKEIREEYLNIIHSLNQADNLPKEFIPFTEQESKTKPVYDKFPISLPKRLIRIIPSHKMTNSLAQIFTGHGAFRQYLHRFKLLDNPFCSCDKETIQNVIHALVDCPSNCHLQAFADDVLLLVHGRSIKDIEDSTNLALEIITEWGVNSKLTFGPSKTQLVSFTQRAEKARIYMNNTLLKYNPQMKLLGVIIDKKLKYINHVKSALSKANLIYLKLSKFVRPTWGIHPENIRIIYERVIQPIVTYAAGIWGKAVRYKCVIDELRSFQRNFAIKAIRGFRTISAVAAIALSGFTPLHLKIQEIQTIELTKLTGTTHYLPNDIKLEKRSSPSELLHPANRKTIKVNYISSETEIEDLCSERTVKIYTDGSKHDQNKVGAAVVIHGLDGRKIVLKLKLHDSCSVFQAELAAVNRACKWVLESEVHDAIIFTDCMSGLMEIKNKDSVNPHVVSIHNYAYKISQHGTISFAWIKSHIGLAGNEDADSAAKSAALLHKSPDYDRFPLSYVKTKLREETQESMKRIYTETTQGAHTRQWCPGLDTIQKLRSCASPSFELTQILTGHGYHLQYLHRILKKQQKTRIAQAEHENPNTEFLRPPEPTQQPFKHLV